MAIMLNEVISENSVIVFREIIMPEFKIDNQSIKFFFVLNFSLSVNTPQKTKQSKLSAKAAANSIIQ
jgi:hypothetical protein